MLQWNLRFNELFGDFRSSVQLNISWRSRAIRKLITQGEGDREEHRELNVVVRVINDNNLWWVSGQAKVFFPFCWIRKLLSRNVCSLSFKSTSRSDFIGSSHEMKFFIIKLELDRIKGCAKCNCQQLSLRYSWWEYRWAPTLNDFNYDSNYTRVWGALMMNWRCSLFMISRRTCGSSLIVLEPWSSQATANLFKDIVIFLNTADPRQENPVYLKRTFASFDERSFDD